MFPFYIDGRFQPYDGIFRMEVDRWHEDESVRVWILTMESELEGRSETHYFYRLGASYEWPGAARCMTCGLFKLHLDRTS